MREVQVNLKTGALTEFTLHTDAPPHGVNQLLHDGQAQSAADAVLGRPYEPEAAITWRVLAQTEGGVAVSWALGHGLVEM